MTETNKNLERIQKVFLHLQKAFITWANAQDDIRAVIIVGSRYRTDHLPDEMNRLQ